VLQLVEGPTLADRIAQGPIAFDDALPIARQIAEALEAAHEKSIIHRDLKPANIKLTPDGKVKVLDFGLAKLRENEPSTSGQLRGYSPGLTNSPTITTPAMTMAGVILGTAAYMSPEQAKGRPADKRCDIWAFGCVLYEMLTGKRAFEGEDVSDTLAAVLRGEPGLDGTAQRCARISSWARASVLAEGSNETDRRHRSRAVCARGAVSRRSRPDCHAAGRSGCLASCHSYCGGGSGHFRPDEPDVAGVAPIVHSADGRAIHVRSSRGAAVHLRGHPGSGLGNFGRRHADRLRGQPGFLPSIDIGSLAPSHPRKRGRPALPHILAGWSIDCFRGHRSPAF
jgi:serine/threonine protein kinase